MSAMGRTIATLAALTAAAGLAAGVAWMARGPREAALRKAVSTTPRAEGRAAPATQSDSPPPPAPQPSSLTIAGRAIGEDGVAISGGKACLVRGNGEVVSRATTGADGAFSLQVVPAELEAGLVMVEVSATGTARRILRAVILSHEEIEDAGRKIDLLDVVLGVPCSLTVVLRGPEGAPVTGAAVRLQPHISLNAFPHGWFAETDRAVPAAGGPGTHRLDQLPAGRYAIEVDASGFAPPRLDELALPREGPLVIDLDPAWRIEGVVVGPGGEPIGGARIRARAPQVERLRFEAVSAGDGRFAIDGLPRGLYAIEAAGAKGHLALTREDVPAGTTDLLLELLSAAEVTGKVVDGAGAPIAGATVELDGNREATTDPGGAFSIGELQGGRYRIEVLHEGHARWKGEGLTVPAGEQVDAGTIVLQAGHDEEEDHAIQVASPEDVPVRGRVVDSEGKCIVAADVRHGERWTLRTWTTDRQGAFVATIPAGDDRLEVIAAGYCEEGVAFRAPLEKDEELRIVLRREARIRGRLMAGEKPAGGVEVGAGLQGREDSVNAGTTSDSAGYFDLGGLEAGAWRVAAHPRRGEEAVVKGIAVAEGQTVDVGDLRMDAPPEAGISGTAVDEGGRPVADARLSVNVSGGDEEISVTDREGRFRLSGLPARKYRLLARKPGYWFPSAVVRAPAAGVQVVLSRLRGLSGRVVDGASGAPLAVATVFVVSEQATDRALWTHGYVVKAVSDREGRFAFDDRTHRPPIRFIAGVVDGYAMAALDVTGKESGVVLPLWRGVELTAKVIGLDDRALAGVNACVVDPRTGFHRAGVEGTGEDGVLRCGLIREGPYLLLLGRREMGVQKYEVEVGAGMPPPTLRFGGSKPLSVNVLKSDGAPAEEASMVILDSSGGSAFDYQEIFTGLSDGMIADILIGGSRTYGYFPPGRYRLRAKDGEEVTPEVEAVVGDEPAQVTLRFP